MATSEICIDRSVSVWLTSILERIPEVASAYTDVSGDTLSIWFVVSQYDQAVRDKLYDVKEQLYAEFPDAYFEFHILAKPANVPDEEIISDVDLAYRKKIA